MFQQGKLFAALFTLVFFDASMNQLMALQRVVADECFATFVTFELLQLLILLASILFGNFDLGNSGTRTNRLRNKDASLLS